MRNFIFHIVFLLLISWNFSGAQDFKAVPGATKIGLNQTVQIDFTAEGSNVSNFSPPAFGAFSVVSGPSSSSMTTIMNGSMSQSETYTYVLQPTVKGKLTIGSASIKIQGKVYKSAPVTIEVTDAAQGQPNTRGQQRSQNQGQTNIKDLKDNLILRAFVSNAYPFRGQQILLTYKLYYNAQIEQYQRPTPKLDAFWVQQENIPQNPGTSTEVLNGKKYYVATIYKSYIFPQKDGDITIDPLKIEALVRVKTKSNSSPFDDFFNNPFFDNPFQYEDLKYTITSNELKINVRPFPAGKPASFSGITGNYTFTVNTDKTKTKTNDPLTLKIQVSGQGNIKFVEPFDLNLPSDIETFEPKVKENISTSGDLVSGTKVFEYLLVPHKEGNFKIPSLVFSFFDPNKGKYFTLKSGEIKLTITRGSGEAYTASPGVDQKDVEFRGKDIQYIRLVPGLVRNKQFLMSLNYFIWLVIPVLLFVLFLFYKKKIDRERINIALMKKRKASSFARKQLRIAGKMLKENNVAEFYLSVTNAFNNYISDKTGIPNSELSKQHIRENLTARQVDEETILRLIEHLENCEYARYAPSEAGFDLNHFYILSVELLSSLEKQIK